MKKRFSEEQIIGFLRKADKGEALKDLCRRHGFYEAIFISVAASMSAWTSRTLGLTERRCRAIVRMSASELRYRPQPDLALRARIVELAQRYRCYGVGMIYLKLRQAGEHLNYKRV